MYAPIKARAYARGAFFANGTFLTMFFHNFKKLKKKEKNGIGMASAFLMQIIAFQETDMLYFQVKTRNADEEKNLFIEATPM